MRVTSKGQVTIPQEIRERFGFMPETEIDFVIDDEHGRVTSCSSTMRKKTLASCWWSTSSGMHARVA